MKRTSTIVGLSLIAVAMLASPALAQPTGGTSPAPARSVDKASPKLMTGKVTQVDPKTKSFTILVQGKEQRFTYDQPGALRLAVGDVVEVTYTGDPGGLMRATNLNLSRSNY